jgi:DNA-binding transcriptional regulator WhiA
MTHLSTQPHLFNIRPDLRGRKRKYPEPTNLDGFRGPDSDWHAYWLGFIAADGCVFTEGKSGRHSVVRVKLHRRDHDLLENLRAGLGTTVEVKKQMVKGGTYPVSNLEFNSQAFVDVLKPWGIVQNKSLTIPFPRMDDEHMRAFIRGYFDGNGTVMIRSRKAVVGTRPEYVLRFTTGSLDFICGLTSALNRFGIETLKAYRNGKSEALVLPVSCIPANLRAFCSLIYDNASVWLDRKREMLEPFINAD